MHIQSKLNKQRHRFQVALQPIFERSLKNHNKRLDDFLRHLRKAVATLQLKK